MSDSVIIENVLKEISQQAHLLGINIFAVGGFCRNKVLGIPLSLDSDIDLMAEQYNGLKLAGILASSMKEDLEFYHRTGTAAFTHKGVQLEFQYFRPNYEILEELRKIDVPQTNLYRNVYERDFTINTLLYSIRSGKMHDLTNMAVKDITNGIIRTPLDSDVLVRTNPIIILRAIMFANRYDYSIDSKLQSSMREYKELISHQISEERFMLAIDKILKPNRNNGIKLLYEYDIDTITPFSLNEYIEKGSSND